MAIISKGMKLSYKNGAASEFIDLTNLIDVPELGGDTDSVEVTTLGDAAHVYIDGLISYGDNIAFNFYYEKAQFDALSKLEGISEWKVTLPDASTCTWSGSSSVKFGAGAVGAALQYILNIKPNSEMVWA